ncbi:IclR family transcriptional regulator [Saccharopolyspora gloriosae]|uniref:IclR family transcriptional regulator n=1 Tax=Saccharopolyspora gloriosae TaxID=455344 RepID=UPI001FB57B4E|nr:IclR family transcriptional regulator [Saccharopolyspora gloriosae]
MSALPTGGRDPQPTGAKAPSGTLQSVGRALRVLEAIAASPCGISAKDLAAELDLTLPTTYHLLTTLVEAGHVVHLTEQHVFALGYKARFLGQALSRQLAVQPEIAGAIRRLHQHADAAAYYAIYRDTEVVIAHVEDSDRRPRVQPLDVGFHQAAHATAFGKIMLAAMAPEQRARYLEQAGMVPCTPSTIRTAAALEDHLSHVHQSQIALEIAEFQPGLACMASPVFDPAGCVTASVAISLPIAEFRARRWAVERAVRQGAVRVTRSLVSRPAG